MLYLKDFMHLRFHMALLLVHICVQMQTSLKLLDLVRMPSQPTHMHLSGMVMTLELLKTTTLHMAEEHSV